MSARHPWRADWLTVEEALERVLAGVRPLSTERVPTLAALGRTIAETITAPFDHPPWDNAGMDGYAVRAEDVAGATPHRPATLEVIEEVAAGGVPSRSIGPGQATRVMTGAPVPEGADSVIRIEHTAGWAADGELDGRRVVITSDADAGRNIRRRGEDVRRGDTVVPRGRVLRAGEIGALAMAGRLQVLVHRRPVVAILSNGDELVEPDERVERAGHRIFNSNAYGLAAAVASAGAEPRLLGIARDDEAELRTRLGEVAGADVLLTTAGASVGEYDFVKSVLASLGFRLGFWRVRMQPGSPFFFGHLGDTAVIGLPGNPVSALVTFEVLVRPALRRMAGRSDVRHRVIRARLAEAIPPGVDRTRFLRVRLEADGGDEPLARLTGPQGSGILTSLVAADALLVVPAREGVIEPGERLPAILLDPPDPGAPPGR